jgi:hypothetical protein
MTLSERELILDEMFREAIKAEPDNARRVFRHAVRYNFVSMSNMLRVRAAFAKRWRAARAQPRAPNGQFRKRGQ